MWKTESVLVDAMSAKFVLHPEDLSVVVASNLNADILSDLGSALAGSLGLAASANLQPRAALPGMFEPVHGSAPDIAGQDISNPIGAMASGALMLDHFGLLEEASPARGAIAAATGAGYLTRDIGGNIHDRGDDCRPLSPPSLPPASLPGCATTGLALLRTSRCHILNHKSQHGEDDQAPVLRLSTR